MRWLRQALPWLACVVASIAAFAPLSPHQPEAALDPSWMLAMNQAVAQGLVFGRDIVFTFGPWSTLYTQAYHPATYAPALGLGVLLGLACAAMLRWAVPTGRRLWLLAFAGLLLVLDSRDALFFFYPLLVVLLAWQLTRAGTGEGAGAGAGASASAGQGTDGRLAITGPAARASAAGAALLGVLPLVKASFVPLAVASAALACALFWQAGHRRLAGVLVLLPLACMALAWRLAGQPLEALPGYFVAMGPIVSAFAEAMAWYPPTSNWRVMQVGVPGMVAAYVLVGAALLAALWQYRGRTPAPRLALLLAGVALYLFIAFKASFVRFDGHALTAGSALLLLMLALRAFDLARLRHWVLVLGVGSWAFAHAVYVGAHLDDVPLVSLVSALSTWRNGASLQSGFALALQRIQATAQVQKMPGSTDIYPHDLSALIASGNAWAPRPVPQSYSAYTPALAALNQAHLQGAQAPESVVFRMGPIDARYPTLEDGPSWPLLLAHYSLASQDGHYVYLQRQALAHTVQRKLLLQTVQRAGQVVELPPTERLLFAQIDIQPTLLGRVLSALYKPGALYLFVDLRNGQSQRFRLVPGMARAGFVLSPLVQTNADFVQLLQSGPGALQQRQVRRLRIGAADGASLSWQADFGLSLWALDFPPGLVAQP